MSEWDNQELNQYIDEFTGVTIPVNVSTLVLTGKKDHFISFKAHDMQVEALTNAKSVTARVFTKEEQPTIIARLAIWVSPLMSW